MTKRKRKRWPAEEKLRIVLAGDQASGGGARRAADFLVDERWKPIVGNSSKNIPVIVVVRSVDVHVEDRFDRSARSRHNNAAAAGRLRQLASSLVISV